MLFTVSWLLLVIRPLSHVLLFGLILWPQLQLHCVEEKKTYNGYKLLQLERLDVQEVSELQKITDENYEDMDIWSYPTLHSPQMDIAVGPRAIEQFLDLLSQKGTAWRVLVDDLQRIIDNEQQYQLQSILKSRFTAGFSDFRKNLHLHRRRHVVHNVPAFDINQYHNYGEISDWLDSLSEKYADFARSFNVTRTSEKRQLKGILIGSGGSSRQSIWIDAGIHGREWIAPATAIYIINRLTEGYYNNDEETKWMIENYNWYIVPVANPDGYEYTINKDRLWRKTRSCAAFETDNDSQTTFQRRWPCCGVDANRNWGFHWGEQGASKESVCSGIYAGSRPFSEPETLGLKNFIEKIPNLKVYLSFHSYGQLWLAPWGYTRQRPPRFLKQKKLAEKAIEVIAKHGGTNYHFGSISELMYPASGTSIDYVAHKGVPYVFGIELRPEDSDEMYGFLYPPQFISPTGREMFEAMKAIARFLTNEENPIVHAFMVTSNSTTIATALNDEPSDVRVHNTN